MSDTESFDDSNSVLNAIRTQLKNHVPSGWQLTTLGSALKWSSGGTPKRTEVGYFDGEIPWAVIGDLNDGVVTKTANHITQKGLRNSSAKWVEPGSILLAMYGSIGKLGIAGCRMTTNQAIAFTDPAPINSKYLYFYLLWQRRWLARLGRGATQQNISQTVIKEFPLLLAPLDWQAGIVAELEKQFSRLDEAVANLQRVKANLKRYKASVLKAAVEGRLVETEASIAHREGRSYETGAQLLHSTLVARQTQWLGRGKYKSPESPQVLNTSLPEGWTWATLEQLHLQIADVDHKMPKAQDAGIPYISTKDFFGDEGIDFTKAKFIRAEDYEALCRKVKPERGDLLLSRYGTVGEVREVSFDEPFQASYSVAILKPVHGFVPVRFLIAALRSDVVQRQIKRDVRATAQPDLGLVHIRQFVVPVPPMAEQLRILEELDRQLSILRGMDVEVENNLLRAQTLRQATLQRAFVQG